jgi:hypothetical protein
MLLFHKSLKVDVLDVCFVVSDLGAICNRN